MRAVKPIRRDVKVLAMHFRWPDGLSADCLQPWQLAAQLIAAHRAAPCTAKPGSRAIRTMLLAVIVSLKC